MKRGKKTLEHSYIPVHERRDGQDVIGLGARPDEALVVIKNHRSTHIEGGGSAVQHGESLKLDACERIIFTSDDTVLYTQAGKKSHEANQEKWLRNITYRREELAELILDSCENVLSILACTERVDPLGKKTKKKRKSQAEN